MLCGSSIFILFFFWPQFRCILSSLRGVGVVVKCRRVFNLPSGAHFNSVAHPLGAQNTVAPK